MAQPQRLLEGDVIDPPNNGDASDVARLKGLNQSLMRELHDALEENESLRKRVKLAGAPVARLREKVEPLYKILQAIMGDVEELAPEAVPSSQPTAGASTPMSGHATAAWDEWKHTLGGAAAKVITALQTHKDADTTQLCILIGTTRRQTVHDAIHKLNKSGLINKNGDRFSLKQL